MSDPWSDPLAPGESQPVSFEKVEELSRAQRLILYQSPEEQARTTSLSERFRKACATIGIISKADDPIEICEVLIEIIRRIQ